MNRTNSKVDAYFQKAKKWPSELKALRRILLDCGLTEELKWRLPCYTFEGANVAIIQSFKESCALMFFKGALLKDPKKILEKPGDNSRTSRRVPFDKVEKIAALERSLKAYVGEAIDIEKAGLKVPPATTTELKIPDELRTKFAEMPALKKAFQALTPGRQRAYVLNFSAAKQSKTRESRIARWTPHILGGKGLNDP